MSTDAAFLVLAFVAVPAVVLGALLSRAVQQKRRARAMSLAALEADCAVCGHMADEVEVPCSACGWTPALEAHPQVGPWVEAWRHARVAEAELDALQSLSSHDGHDLSLREQHLLSGQSAAMEALRVVPELHTVLGAGAVDLRGARRLVEETRRRLREAIQQAR